MALGIRFGLAFFLHALPHHTLATTVLKSTSTVLLISCTVLCPDAHVNIFRRASLCSVCLLTSLEREREGEKVEEDREMGVATVTELKQSISGKRTFRPSLISRHANEW